MKRWLVIAAVAAWAAFVPRVWAVDGVAPVVVEGQRVSCPTCATVTQLPPEPITIENPAQNDDMLLVRAPRNLTVTAIDCIAIGGTSVALTLRECDANAANCTAVEATITCATTNTTESGAIDAPTIEAGNYLRVLVGTVSGVVTQAHMTVTME
jgi:hypothetical protein